METTEAELPSESHVIAASCYQGSNQELSSQGPSGEESDE